MSCERDLDEIVSKCLISTCLIRPPRPKYAVLAAIECARLAADQPDDSTETRWTPLTTGSVAEFYIEPMLPLFGDIDVMLCSSARLAIPRGQSPPTQLPAEFHNCVKVAEINDSHLPGYVYLDVRYLLTERSDVDGGKYNAEEYDKKVSFTNRYRYAIDGDIHGPAINVVEHELSTDYVHCVRCLSWPPQAADWPTRHRNYDWPDSATVDHVVNNGCDVVRVAHRQCREHEWMAELQWRLSFSRAEIVLMNSWMPVQQIVYHMLRVFMKAERLTDSADNSGAGRLNNYHIKTLMLWACELKPKSWWTDDLSLIGICVELLHSLAEWLTGARYPHYFINNCNLVDNLFSATNITSLLIDKRWLSLWFVDNYIRKYSEVYSQCPDSISRLFDDVSTSMKLQKAVSAIVAWRLNNSLFGCWMSFTCAPMMIVFHASKFQTARACSHWIKELTKIDSNIYDFLAAVIFLHVPLVSRKHGFNDELMDIITTVLGHFISPQRHSKNFTSEMALVQSVKLMRVVANNSHNTVQLIEMELSKAYLYRALRCKDAESDSIYCLANVYLAVLYYTTGQYQTAIDHCTLVTRSQDHSQCSSHVVQGELLPKIDDDINFVLGLAVFYQHVRTAALNQQQSQHVAVFTTELLAYCLNIKCRQFTQTSPLTNTFKLYEVCLVGTRQLFVSDVLLFWSASRSLKQKFYGKPISHERSQYYSALYPTDDNASCLVELLQQSAVERLTTYRQLEARNFGSVVATVTTDFEAMYAYKRGDYQRCLQLSTRNVHTLLFLDRDYMFMSHVLVFPEFIQLLDDDIVSLTALTLIVNPDCRNRLEDCCISQLTLSLYLMTQCQLKIRDSVTSLAQTLDYIEDAQCGHDKVDSTLNQLLLKLAERKVVIHLSQYNASS